jgi:hypothetical protein
MDIQPSGVADAVEAYGDTAVPELAETEGFRGVLLVDRDTGHLISETIWRNPQALAASRSVAAAVGRYGRVDGLRDTRGRGIQRHIQFRTKGLRPPDA